MNKCTHMAELLEKHFDTAFTAPNGIKKLRELILTLAMQGKLVLQNPNDIPASELLRKIEAEKQRLVKEGKIKKPKPLPSVTEEEKPYALPQEWEWTRLGEISSYIQRGKGPSYVDFSNHRVISQKCVRWYGLDLEPARYIDPESLKKYESIRFLQVGDLLWNSTGTGTIGRACLVPYDLNSKELVADSHVTIVRALNINNRFLWYWIQSPWVQMGIETSASGTTNQIELNTSTVINHLMPLPPLAEQNRIVAKIDELMARCNELEKLRTVQQGARLTVHAAAIKQLLNIAEPDQHQRARAFLAEHFGELYTVKENVAELRKAILQLAVMGKLVPQNSADQPASELLKEIKAEKQRLAKESKIKEPKPLPPVPAKEKPNLLPPGWAMTRFGDLATEIATGPFGSMIHKSDYISGGIPLINPSHMIGGNILHDPSISVSTAKAEKLDSYRLSENDIVMARRGEMGRCAIVTTESDGFLCGTGSFILRFINQIDRQYILAVFKTDTAREFLGGNSVGTTMTNLNHGILNKMPILLPPCSEQHRIVMKINKLMALCDVLDLQIDTTTRKQAELLDTLINVQSRGAEHKSQPVSLLKAQVIDLTSYRAAIGCYVIKKLANAQYFGRTAAAKMMYLAQAHVGLALDLHPVREAAGPLDTWIYDFERQGQGKGWFEVSEKSLANGKKKTKYRCLSALLEPAVKAEALMSSGQKAEFDRLIYALADKKTEEVELIATLFAVWNDFLIDGIQPTNEQIISDVRENWHERKTRFSPAELCRWLDWLHRESIIPRGLPPRTVQQTMLGLIND